MSQNQKIEVLSSNLAPDQMQGLMTLPNTIKEKIFSQKNLAPITKLDKKQYSPTRVSKIKNLAKINSQ